MKWVKNLINKIFNKNTIELLSNSNPTSSKASNSREDYLVSLKSLANPEQDDKNGYGIQRNLSLKDMM